jgi:hypothetical protein
VRVPNGRIEEPGSGAVQAVDLRRWRVAPAAPVLLRIEQLHGVPPPRTVHAV